MAAANLVVAPGRSKLASARVKPAPARPVRVRARVLLSAVPVLLAVAPFSGAQTSLGEVEVVVAPFAAPIVPLKEVGVTNVTVRVPCSLLLDEPLQSKPVTLSVPNAPAWAQVTLNPATLLYAPSCDPGSTVEQSASLLVATTAEAPAFVPTGIRVRASLESRLGNGTGEGGNDVEAGYYGILDATVDPPVRVSSPGTPASFALGITNHGNGATRVAFRVEQVTAGWDVRPPEPFTLAPRFEKGAATRVVDAVFTPPPRDGIVNEPGLATIVVEGASVAPGGGEASPVTVSLLLTSKRVDVTGGVLDAPAPQVALAVALAAGAALALRRR